MDPSYLNCSIESQINYMIKLINRGINLKTKCFLLPFVKVGSWLMIAVDCRNERILLIRSSTCNYFNFNEPVISDFVNKLNTIFFNNNIFISNYTKGTIIGNHSLHQCGAFIVYVAKIMANRVINIDEEQTISNIEEIDQFKLKILELLLSKMIENFDQISTQLKFIK